MVGQSRYSTINEILNQTIEEKKSLIAVHRGAWGGNIIENTTPSYLLARDMGADMFECDLSKSVDGVIYAFHDGGERRMLGISPNIKTLSSTEIDTLLYRNSLGEPSGVKVERFSSIAANFNHGELYNIDRSWDYLHETTEILKQYPWAIKQALIKTHVRDDSLQFFNECPEKYMYMPIVYTMADVENVLSYPDINLVGMELIALTPESELFQDNNIQYIKSKGLFIWANAITLSGLPQHILFGGLDDDAAILTNKETTWGKLYEKGIDVIQTDWPFQLKKYRDCYFGL